MMDGVKRENAIVYDQVGEITVVKLPRFLRSQEACDAVDVQLQRLLDDQRCDFILDFADTDFMSTRFIAHLIRLARRAKTVAEQTGKRTATPACPRGQFFKMFDDRASAVEEMSQFDGHGWCVFCSVAPDIREAFLVI